MKSLFASLLAITSIALADEAADAKANALDQASQKPISSNKHPDAQWFPDAGLGLFIHWGIASVGASGDISWVILANKPWKDKAVTLNGATITHTTTHTTTNNNTITNDSQTFAMNANGVVIKVDSSTNIIWRIGGRISGSGILIKSGPGLLDLGQNNNSGPENDFSVTLTVNGGTLNIRHGDSFSTTAGGSSVQDAILLMQNSGQSSGSTITVNEPLEFSGSAFLIGYCKEIKSFTQQINSTINVAADTVLGISTARNSSASIAPLLEIIDSSIVTVAVSVLRFGLRPPITPAGASAASQTINVGSHISGPGAVIAHGDAGSVYTLASPGYTGNTTVNSATLKLNAPIPDNQSSTVTIAATGATLELNFDESGGIVTDIVDKLFIGGIQQSADVYKATDNVTDAGIPTPKINGPDTFAVTTSPSGFNTWATSNGIPGALPEDDAEFNRLYNLTEYALGTNPTASTPAPVSWLENTIIFTKGAAAIASAGVNYIIETSTDLGVNDPWTEGVTQTTPNSSTTMAYTFTPGSPARTFARLRTLLIP